MQHLHDLRALRHLILVAEQASFSRAATLLHLTQPALSRSIQGLEARAGGALLTRARGAVEPTELGQVLLRHARGLDQAMRELDRDLARSKGLETGELRIGVGPFGGATLAGPVVGRLLNQHPGVHIKLVVAPWRELPERALAREIDLLIGVLDELQELDDFAHQALATHRCTIVSRAGHPLIKRRKPSSAEALSYPLAGPALTEAARRALREALPDTPRRQPLAVECDAAPQLAQVLLESDAVSLMPRFLVADLLAAGRLHWHARVPFNLPLRFGAAWLRQRPLSLAAQRFVALLVQHDAQLAKAVPTGLTRLSP